MRKQLIIKFNKKKYAEILVYLLILAFVAITAYKFHNQEFGYKRYETATLSYDKAKVLKIEKQDLKLSETDDYMSGYQIIKVELLSGKNKGKVVTVQNDLTASHNILAKVGHKIIICSDIPNNGEPYYTVYNHYRSPMVWGIVIFFLLMVIVVGGAKGMRSALSLVFTFFMIICFLLPALYSGDSPIITTIISSSISTAVALYLLNGLSFKTFIDILSTTAGVICAGIIFLIISKVLSISGYQTDEAESLILIAQSTGLHIKGILFAGVLTASLGAVMDIAVSIGASLYEIARITPNSSTRSLFLSGMNIGKDMIGTMANTLILAFAGSSMMTLLIFVSYGVQYHQLMSSDYVAVELAEAIAGSAAVVIMVPVTSVLCAIGYSRLKFQNGGKS